MRRLLPLLLFLPLLVAGPALADPVSGTVTYRERIALPPESVVTVRLIDAARQDAAAVVLAETRRLTLGAPPYAFALEVDPHLLGERRRQLRLEATIEVAGRVRMRTTEAHLLTPESFAAPVALTLHGIETRPDDAAPPLACTPADGAWSFDLVDGIGTLRLAGPSAEAHPGRVGRSAEDVIVWQGGPPLGGRFVAVFRADACGADAPWSLTLVGGGTVRQGCCTDAPR